MFCGNVAAVEILNSSSHSVDKFIAARRFTADYLTRYHHGINIYHPEHKHYSLDSNHFLKSSSY